MLSVGCTEEQSIIQPNKPNIVVWGFFHPQQIFLVKLASSMAIENVNTIDTTGIQDAIVLLYEDGKLIDTLKHQQKGTYRSSHNIKPQVGHVYFITAQKTGYPSIETQPDTMPDLLKLQSVKATWAKIQNYYVGLLEAEFEAYPKVAHLGLNCEALDQSGTWRIKTEATCMDEIFFLQHFNYHDFSCFPGLNIIQLYGSSFTTSYPKEKELSLRFSFAVPSRNLSTYFQKFIEHDRSVSDLSSVDIFAQPIFLPDMVKNGYGFVGCFNSQSQILKVE
ncbi:DUF4249 family protein [Haliscomenobacter sp.]|uniref:DUF4249 family protein n=1 Tax=Haliscomenobacter sp. TaxID=2717303 RepID=UPI00359406EA